MKRIVCQLGRAHLGVPCPMKKQGSVNFTVSVLCVAAFSSLTGIVHSGQSLLPAVGQPGSPPGEHALISGSFPSDSNPDRTLVSPQGAVRNGFSRPGQHPYAYCLVKASIGQMPDRGASKGDGAPGSGLRILVYTARRSLLLYRGRKLLAAYPVAVGRDNAWLDASNNGAPIELAGRTYRAKRGENLWSISRRFAMDMWTLASFNALSIKSPLRPGQEITIPKRPIHITPYGIFKITNKLVNPVFKSGERTVQPFFRDQENILGSRWIGLSNSPYGIHGTNSPQMIGTYSTRGCVRMFNDDIDDVFGLVRVGADVLIQRAWKEPPVLRSESDYAAGGEYD